MRRRGITKWTWAVGLLCFAGCLHPVAEQTDASVSQLASRPIDVEAIPAPERTCRAPAQTDPILKLVVHRPKTDAAIIASQRPGAPQQSEQPTPPSSRPPPRRLEVPPELPGAGAPRVTLPPTTAPARERESALNKLFPSLRPLGPDPEPSPGPNGEPLSLT